MTSTRLAGATLVLSATLAFGGAADDARARLETLTEKAAAQGIIGADEAQRLRADLDVLQSPPPPSEQAPVAMDWVSFVAQWLPRVGGLALALGLLLWLARALRRAGRLVQATAAGLVAGGLWGGARAVDLAGHPTTAGALVLSGCLASLVSVALLFSRFGHGSVALRVIGAVVTALWGTVAWALSSAAGAYLTALAFAVTLGVEVFEHWDRRSTRVRHRTLLVGVVLVGAGYVIRGLAPASLGLLVHPLWMVGLGAAFLGSALGWSWRIFDEQSRWLTLALAAASTVWGVWAGQGVFAGAGGVALVVWGFACLVELIPRRVPDSLKWMATGAAMLGLTVPLDRHWPLIVEVVSRGW